MGGRVREARALMAFKGEGTLVPGDHCRFCRAKPPAAPAPKKRSQLARQEFVDVGATMEDVQPDEPGIVPTFHFKHRNL